MSERPPIGAQWKRAFFTITAGQAFSLIGSSAVQFALIWWLASETGSPMMLSLAGLFAFLPQMLLGPFAGVWVDRWKRKTVVVCADLFLGLVAGLFALAFVFGKPPYWTACAVLGVRAVGNVFHTPAIQAVVPMLVPEDELVRANGWSNFLQSGAFMLGPVLGAAMYAMFPLPVILLTDLLGALVASGTMLLVKVPEPGRTGVARPQLLSEMREGLQVFLEDRRLLIVTLAATLAMIFYMPLSSMYPLMTSDYFSATAWHASAVELLYAGGMMLASLLLGLRGGEGRQFPIIHLGLLGLGLTSLLCGLLPRDMAWFWVFAGLCALMGGSGTLYNVPYVAYMQKAIAPERLGRVFSLTGSLMSLAMPVGLLIAGPVAQKEGVNTWFMISGIATLMITAASALAVLRKFPKC